MNTKSKIAALGIIVLIFIVPYFISKSTGKSTAPQKEATAPVQETKAPLDSEKNVRVIGNLNSEFSGDNLAKTININGNIWMVGEKNIISPTNNKTYDIATEFQDPDLVFEMDDLNLIFLVKNKQITSFSVNNGKFLPNNIAFPDESSLASGKAYLTYAYFLDTANNQIYRYPRADGGFGEKSNWLKNSPNLSKFKDMAINDNIFVTDGKNILKFFQGKEQDFSLETTKTPVSISKLYTKPGSENLYILDRDNERIIKAGPDGSIIAQYYNSKFADTLDFAVNEENQKIYINTAKTLESFEM